MLQATFREYSLIRSNPYEWYSRFKSGPMSFEDDAHQDKLSISHIDETMGRVAESIRIDRRLSFREVAGHIEISKDMYCKSNWRFGMGYVSEILMFCPIGAAERPDNNLHWPQPVSDNFSQISGDEACVNGYDPEIKHRACQWYITLPADMTVGVQSKTMSP